MSKFLSENTDRRCRSTNVLCLSFICIQLRHIQNDLFHTILLLGTTFSRVHAYLAPILRSCCSFRVSAINLTLAILAEEMVMSITWCVCFSVGRALGEDAIGMPQQGLVGSTAAFWLYMYELRNCTLSTRDHRLITWTLN